MQQPTQALMANNTWNMNVSYLSIFIHLAEVLLLLKNPQPFPNAIPLRSESSLPSPHPERSSSPQIHLLMQHLHRTFR